MDETRRVALIIVILLFPPLLKTQCDTQLERASNRESEGERNWGSDSRYLFKHELDIIFFSCIRSKASVQQEVWMLQERKKKFPLYVLYSFAHSTGWCNSVNAVAAPSGFTLLLHSEQHQKLGGSFISVTWPNACGHPNLGSHARFSTQTVAAKRRHRSKREFFICCSITSMWLRRQKEKKLALQTENVIK